MKFTEEQLKLEHQRCRCNKSLLTASGACNCFFCLRIFPAGMIESWVDSGVTALCPFCGIDSVVPQVNPDLLQQLHDYYFRP